MDAADGAPDKPDATPVDELAGLVAKHDTQLRAIEKEWKRADRFMADFESGGMGRETGGYENLASSERAVLQRLVSDYVDHVGLKLLPLVGELLRRDLLGLWATLDAASNPRQEWPTELTKEIRHLGLLLDARVKELKRAAQGVKTGLPTSAPAPNANGAPEPFASIAASIRSLPTLRTSPADHAELGGRLVREALRTGAFNLPALVGVRTAIEARLDYPLQQGKTHPFISAWAEAAGWARRLKGQSVDDHHVMKDFDEDCELIACLIEDAARQAAAAAARAQSPILDPDHEDVLKNATWSLERTESFDPAADPIGSAREWLAGYEFRLQEADRHRHLPGATKGTYQQMLEWADNPKADRQHEAIDVLLDRVRSHPRPPHSPEVLLLEYKMLSEIPLFRRLRDGYVARLRAWIDRVETFLSIGATPTEPGDPVKTVGPAVPVTTGDSEPLEVDGKTGIRRPSDEALAAWRLRDATGKNQTQIAATLSKELGVEVKQWQVHRWLKDVEAYLRAGNILPNPVPLKKRAVTVDPDVIDMGERVDKHTRNQREKPDDSGD